MIINDSKYIFDNQTLSRMADDIKQIFSFRQKLNMGVV